MPITNCRHFNGYKPCGRNEICDSLCPSSNIPKERILLIHLEALGAVVRSTSLLAGIKRKYPDSHVTWVTSRPADQLLKGIVHIDRVLTTTPDDLLALKALKFDVAFCIDKSLKAIGVLAHTQADQVFGFTADPRTGAILPATDSAKELWELGLNDHKKFFVNQKPETLLSREALDLPGRPPTDGEDNLIGSDEYQIQLSLAEIKDAEARRRHWAGLKDWVVGINTGCANTIPYKKMTVEMQREIVLRLSQVLSVRVVLLGGKEDEIRNQRIAHGLDVVQSPTRGGLRDGLVSIEACDIVITGDSLGMHMSIALKKWVVAWFGPTCAHEIELYGRGVKVQTQAGCSPCWKRSCNKDQMCYDLVPVAKILDGVARGMRFLDATDPERTSINRGDEFGRAKENTSDSDGVRGGSSPGDPAAETTP